MVRVERVVEKTFPETTTSMSRLVSAWLAFEDEA